VSAADPLGLSAFFLLGLGGAAHCVGMCGGFAVAVGTSAPGRPGAWTRQLCFVSGKAATYLTLGAGAILVARALHLAAHEGELARAALVAQSALAWLAGTVMVLLGLVRLGLVRPGTLQRPWTRLGRAGGLFTRLFRGARAIGGGAGAFAAGLVTGLLPCGLSWSAIALATQVDPATAILGLGLFDAATAPALTAVGLGGARLALLRRPSFAALSGLLLVALGSATIVRGGMAPVDLLRGESGGPTVPRPDCCGDEAPAPPPE